MSTRGQYSTEEMLIGEPKKFGNDNAIYFIYVVSCVMGSPNKKGGSPMEKKLGASPPFPSTSLHRVDPTTV